MCFSPLRKMKNVSHPLILCRFCLPGKFDFIFIRKKRGTLATISISILQIKKQERNSRMYTQVSSICRKLGRLQPLSLAVGSGIRASRGFVTTNQPRKVMCPHRSDICLTKSRDSAIIRMICNDTPLLQGRMKETRRHPSKLNKNRWLCSLGLYL